MEPRRHAVRQPHARHRFAFEVARVEDHQVGGLVRQVDHEADQPALVLAGIGRSGDEDELTRMPALAEFMHLPGARLQVVLVEPRARDREPVLRQRHRIGIAIGLAEAPLVRPRERG